MRGAPSTPFGRDLRRRGELQLFFLLHQVHDFDYLPSKLKRR